MAKHTSALATQARTDSARGPRIGSRIRASRTLPALAFSACVALVLVPVVDPTSAFAITDQTDAAQQQDAYVAGQTLISSADYKNGVDRDGFKITQAVIKKAETSAAAATATLQAAGKPDPGSAKAIAYDMVKAKGWDDKQYTCLVALWNRESHWNVYAANPSGAYGIPQARPGVKMSGSGPDWQSNATTQITWGLGYISSRYGTPCGAWASSEARGWY